MNNGKGLGRRRALCCFLAFAGTVLLLTALLAAGGYAPLGDNSLATSDARIQYLDFFNYYKDVLEGRNTIAYSFSNGLGGNGIGLFSYYLASPLNLLVVFFKKEQMHIFLNLLVVLKLGLAAASFAYFVQRRFGDRLHTAMAALLSMGYGLMQYNISRGSNVMWLDGVIFLPLMLLGAYRIVRSRRLASLTVPTALCILCNWYTGGINCLYCILWFAFEYLLAEAQGEAVSPFSDRGKPGPAGLFGRFFGAVFRYGAAMAAGVCISGVLFMPAASMMRKGKGSEFYPELYLRSEMNGELRSAFSGYILGELSKENSVALYCGAFAMIGVLAFFLCRRIRIREKILGGAILLVTILTYYWQPLFYIFSLFKRVDSYYFRYGYLGSFALLFLAGWYFSTLFPGTAEEDEERDGRKAAQTAAMLWDCLLPLLCGILFIVLSVTVGEHHLWNFYTVRETHLCMAGEGLLLTILAFAMRRRGEGRKSTAPRLAAVLLACLCFADLGRNTVLLLDVYYSDTASSDAAYAAHAQALADSLKEYDSGFYRVSTTQTRDMVRNGYGAAYNDALAYGYNGIGGYTSSPENDQLYLLDRLGYREEGACMNIINTCFLPADSFLGVKYVLSPRPYSGLERVEELEEQGGKAVYENPYVLPMAFVYDGAMLPQHRYEDPFTYEEEVYTALSGEQARLFVPLQYRRYEQGIKTVWELKVPEGIRSAYGNLPWDEETYDYTGSLVSTGEGIHLDYSGWLSPSVFYIPVNEEKRSARAVMTKPGSEYLTDAQFYGLDLDRLGELSEKIREKAQNVSDLSIGNGSVSCNVQAQEGEYLFLLLSRTAGWDVRVNGRSRETEEFGYCMTVIPLDPGENRIEMTFRIPYLRAGLLFTVFGILFLLLWDIMVYRKGKKNASVSDHSLLQ